MINIIPYFFPFFFIGMWTLVTYAISRMGWSNLVDKYLFQDQFIGQRIGIISATINNAKYNGSLVMQYNQDGIYLRPILLFRLFHKPILIPWSEIKEVRTKKILFTTLKELVIGHPLVAIVTLHESTFREIENQLKRNYY